MKQLLSGLEHCHNNGVLHRDVKGSNLLIDNEGILKIADFGLASFYDPEHQQPMTSRVVTLWYRPPELLLGATNYGVGVDLWSAGCILAELLARKPIFPGRTEVLYSLCYIWYKMPSYFLENQILITFLVSQTNNLTFKPHCWFFLLVNYLCLSLRHRGQVNWLTWTLFGCLLHRLSNSIKYLGCVALHPRSIGRNSNYQMLLCLNHNNLINTALTRHSRIFHPLHILWLQHFLLSIPMKEAQPLQLWTVK